MFNLGDKFKQIQMMQKLFQNPDFQAVMRHPKMQELMKDPEFMVLVQSQQMDKLAQHPKFAALVQDPEMIALFSKLKNVAAQLKS